VWAGAWRIKATSAVVRSGMAGVPIPVGSEAFFEFMRDSFIVVVDEAVFNLRGNAMPVAVYVGGKIDFGCSCAAQVAFADGPGKWFNVVGQRGLRVVHDGFIFQLLDKIYTLLQRSTMKRRFESYNCEDCCVN
jgi:hypothetical protein